MIFSLIVYDKQFIISHIDIANRIINNIIKGLGLIDNESKNKHLINPTLNEYVDEFYLKMNFDMNDVLIRHSSNRREIFRRINAIDNCTKKIYKIIDPDIDNYLEFKEREELRLLDELLEEYE